MSALLQTPQGDLDLSSGNLVVSLDFDVCLAQKLTNRFQLFKGEWFRDRRVGVPMFQIVFVKNPDLNAISQLFRRVITQTPGVASILQSTLNYYSNLRKLAADFKIQSQTGAIIQGGNGTPFIVTLNGKNQQ